MIIEYLIHRFARGTAGRASRATGTSVDGELTGPLALHTIDRSHKRGSSSRSVANLAAPPKLKSKRSFQNYISMRY
jgi:hypothetical protein